MKKEREGLWQTHGVSVLTESMSNPDMEHTHKWFDQDRAHHTKLQKCFGTDRKKSSGCNE